MKNIIKTNKKQLIIGMICLISSIVLIALGVSLADPNSGKAAYLKDQVVDGLSFEKADLVYEGGISTYTVEVHNDKTTNYTLKNIMIIFKDSAGNEITRLLGYIGEEIKSEDAKFIKASIDLEITNISTVEYSIQK